MTIWHPTPEGYLECFIGNSYGVIGLIHRQLGWAARLDCVCGTHTAPALYHTAHEAKAWVEARVHTRCP